MDVHRGNSRSKTGKPENRIWEGVLQVFCGTPVFSRTGTVILSLFLHKRLQI